MKSDIYQPTSEEIKIVVVGRLFDEHKIE